MTWLFYALLAPAVYSIINFSDKFILSKKVKNYAALPLYTALFGMLTGLFVLFMFRSPMPHSADLALIVLTGILTLLSQIFYFKALEQEEASSLIILFQTLPIISLIMAWVFLHQIPSPSQMVGFIFILTGAGIISLVDSREKKTVRFSKAFFLMLAYNVLWAGMGILVKFLSKSLAFSSIVAYEGVGMGVGGLLLYLCGQRFRSAFHSSVRRLKLSTLGIIALNDGLFTLGKSLSYYAFFLGPVALVSVLESTQVFYGLVFAYILTTWFPQIVKEDLSKGHLMRKVFASFLIFFGIIILHFR